MQLGFVIDHSRCIGCHACTVACKAENDVPLGSFRTWVKYTEEGLFPSVRRSFAVLRCNQCTSAPCVEICPVRALEKREDGIVDVDPAACIGCKACMQGCPYDALYLHPAKGTAEKCHFCAHRTEVGLAPACAVVCPTEAIIPGDFHDPESAVARLRATGGLTARKPEAGTVPNVLYREVAEAGIEPARTHGSGGYLWSGRLPGPRLAAESFEAGDLASPARTSYTVDHPIYWGRKVSAYLFTKSLAAGAFMALAFLLPSWTGGLSGEATLLLCGLALGFLALTTVLLVADLGRPERFLFTLLRANRDSWLARGSLILVVYSGLLVGLTALTLAGRPLGRATAPVLLAGLVLAALTACYTGWLFGQSKGRVLWMRRGLWLHLIVQAALAGGALALIVVPWLRLSPPQLDMLRWAVLAALGLHGLLVLAEPGLAPARREEEYRRASRLTTHGPYARRHWAVGVGVGIALPGLLLATPGGPVAWTFAAVAALFGLLVEEDILVAAGQALPIS